MLFGLSDRENVENEMSLKFFKKVLDKQKQNMYSITSRRETAYETSCEDGNRTQGFQKIEVFSKRYLTSLRKCDNL